MIAITAPASPIRDRAKLECGVRYLESLGYRVVIGHSVESYDGYLAGSDQLRAKELERFFTDPTIGAIFCARGGYGTTRLLELLDWEKIRRNPKIIVGFSDITALQWALLTRAAMPSLSGLMVGVDFADLDPASESLFWSLLTESELRERHVWQGTPDDCIIGGYGSGRLLPGTLTLVAALCGTPFIPPLDSNILVLEDVGEDSYRIDRMLCQLSLAGILRQCSALAFGAFTPDATLQRSTPDRPLRTIFAEYAHKAGDKPSVMNLPYGHIRGKISLPLGLWARLNADRQQLVLTEALVR
ncbi:MAG: LD-carboxypeptidase [Chlorobi bacterium]|nr:LD-carboxypeptidase [Chlorobiota bacterium]